MTRTVKILLILFVAIIIFTAVSAYLRPNSAEAPAENVASTTTASSTGENAVATTTTPDGDYYAYVKAASLGTDGATLTLEHVAYFTGDEARSTAKHDVECPSGDIDACVPTLQNGYYVRDSGAPDFVVTATKDTQVSISTTTEAQLMRNPSLSALGSYKPVVLVTVNGDRVVSIKEVTRQ